MSHDSLLKTEPDLTQIEKERAWKQNITDDQPSCSGNCGRGNQKLNPMLQRYYEHYISNKRFENTGFESDNE
jgi:hypothetical protein